MFNEIVDDVAVNDGTSFVHFSATSFVIGLVLIPVGWAKTPIIATSFSSLSLFGLSGFQWQHSLECLDLLH